LGTRIHDTMIGMALIRDFFFRLNYREPIPSKSFKPGLFPAIRKPALGDFHVNRLAGGLAIGFALAGVSALAYAQGEAEKRQLDALRARIERMRTNIAEAEGSRTEARDQLRDSERAISEANRKLRALTGRRSRARDELKTLNLRAQTLESEIAMRRERLGRLLSLRYVHGEQSYLKLFLSGEDPSRVARELQYYGYVSRAQVAFIGELRSDLVRLRDLEAGARQRNAELADIESALRGERSSLVKQRAERRRVLQRVSSELRKQHREVRTLERDESRLSQLIEELGRVISSTALLRNDQVPQPGGSEGPFAGLKHELRLPIKGVLANRFGAQRPNGGPPWKGLFIRSQSGQEVRAVASGRVVFADWLRGFGNLLIIDHGQGYLTIYGNNESVLKEVGEVVRTGDAVATVGASGGNQESGLYFEIRHKGKAFDPLRWVSLK
jgi:septal ring factor EnvC (AmiA/AmiB activator)